MEKNVFNTIYLLKVFCFVKERGRFRRCARERVWVWGEQEREGGKEEEEGKGGTDGEHNYRPALQCSHPCEALASVLSLK